MKNLHVISYESVLLPDRCCIVYWTQISQNRLNKKDFNVNTEK